MGESQPQQQAEVLLPHGFRWHPDPEMLKWHNELKLNFKANIQSYSQVIEYYHMKMHVSPLSLAFIYGGRPGFQRAAAEMKITAELHSHPVEPKGNNVFLGPRENSSCTDLKRLADYSTHQYIINEKK